jgi:hypothetical protein
MSQPKKTKTEFSATVVKHALNQRFNPLPNLSPELLMNYHAQFIRGTLRPAAMLWEQIEQTDDMLITVSPKRKKAVSRHGFDIITVDDSAKAKKHKKTLEEFYNNLIACNAVELNERGGFPLLVRQMMDAEGKKFAVHEIVWKPGAVFSAEFRFTPLWFFENTTGKLRFLKTGFGTEGEDMPDGEWMVTTGTGIMRACAAAYMFKHLPMQDWLIYSENYARPIPKGTSTGVPGSAEWDAMEEAVANLAACEGVVVSQGSQIDAIDLGIKGELPYPKLIERMDRAMAAMWRGGDLSTMSQGSGDGTGASVQGEETDILENDDAKNITDVLNEQVDKWVIRYVHGDLVPLAWVRVTENISQDVKLDLETDKGLLALGYEEPVEELQKRYNRPHLQKKQAAPAPEIPIPAGNVLQIRAADLPWWKRLLSAANEKNAATKPDQDVLLKNSRKAILMARAEDMQPVADRLTQIVDETPEGELFAALEKFRTNELPELAKKALAGTAGADAMANAMTAALFNGLEGA